MTIDPSERVLDRRPEFDPRSKAFPIRALVAGAPRSYTWNVPTDHAGTFPLDQGREGACVGFAWAHELAARPVIVRGLDDVSARFIYRAAQEVDEWPGEDYDGTSVLAGAKVCHAGGHLLEYRWAFGLDDLILAIGRHGPAVLGIDWHEGMDNPDGTGTIHATGAIRGGHAILANAVSLRRQAVGVYNSWGPSWGLRGRAWIPFEDMSRLLAANGEACIPVLRR